MYLYKIGYHSYEDSSYIELEHEKRFTKEELNSLIADATVEVIKQLKEDPESYYVHNFSDICSGNYKGIGLGHCLIEKFGFKAITYEQVFSTFGWPSIFCADDWQDERSESLNLISQRVQQAGFTKKDDTHYQYQEEMRIQYLKEHPEATNES